MRRPDLSSDCSACAALCCVATSFERSEDFAFDKPAGARCRHLTANDRCSIHEELAARGCRGCALYECHGAGQRATRAFAAQPHGLRDRGFLVLRSLHEWLWLLTEATKLLPAAHPELRVALEAQIDALDEAAELPPALLIEQDLSPLELRTKELLLRVGATLGGRGTAGGRSAG